MTCNLVTSLDGVIESLSYFTRCFQLGRPLQRGLILNERVAICARVLFALYFNSISISFNRYQMRKQQFEEESYLPSISIQFQFHLIDIKWESSNLCKCLICPQFQFPSRVNTMDMKRTSIELCVYHINHSITADLVWVKEEEIQFETNNTSKLAS